MVSRSLRPALLLPAVLLLCVCSSGSGGDGAWICRPTEVLLDDDEMRFRRVRDCSEMSGFLVAAVLSSPRAGPPMASKYGERVGNSALASADSGASDYTRTNVQEAGVDEADIVKTDGKSIYLIDESRRSLTVLSGWPPEQASQLSSLDLRTESDDFWPAAMLLHEDRLAIMGHRDPTTRGDVIFRSVIRIVDVSNPAQPRIERTLEFETEYSDARLIDGRLIVVGESYLKMPQEISDELEAGESPYLPFPYTTVETDSLDDKRGRIKTLVSRTDYDDWLPSYRDRIEDGEPATRRLITSHNDLWMPSVAPELGLLVVLSLDLAKKGGDVKASAVLTRGGVIYATQSHLYAAFGRWWSGGLNTSIQKFSFAASGLPEYAGGGTAPGSVWNSFQMGEQDGFLRVATTSYSIDTSVAPGACCQAQSTNNLVVLGPQPDGNLAVVGGVYGFADGERITSSRFLGDRGFVGTYHFVIMWDPLFTFDLTDPYSPKLMGELEMPGYTSYIHPFDDDHILGVGMFAERMGDPVTSVQVQLFDVSDFANPITSFQEVISMPDGRSFSETLSEHHAFTWYGPRNIFAFPVSAWWNGWDRFFNGLYAYKVDTATGFTPLAVIDHADLAATYDPDAWRNSDVRRSIIMTDPDDKPYLYSISRDGMKVNTLDGTNSELSRVVFY